MKLKNYAKKLKIATIAVYFDKGGGARSEAMRLAKNKHFIRQSEGAEGLSSNGVKGTDF